MERFGNELLTYVRAVGVSRVDEVDAELNDPAQYGSGLVAIRRVAPDPSTGDPHRSEAQPVDRHGTANVNRSGVRRRRSSDRGHSVLPPTELSPTILAV
jgi:hypothetical protein